LLSRYLGALSDDTNLRIAIMKSVKPGLGQSLTNVSRRLNQLSDASTEMANHSAAEGKKAWTEVAAQTMECQKALEMLRAVYALSPEEEEFFRNVNVGGLKMSEPTTQPSPTTKTSK
jgi:hypothetical protein